MVPVRAKVSRHIASRTKLFRSKWSSCLANDVAMAAASMSSGIFDVGSEHGRVARTLVSGVTVILPERTSQRKERLLFPRLFAPRLSFSQRRDKVK